MHQLPAEYEEWLTAAAMLQEVGSYVNRGGRHRHTYYIVANSEIFGYTTEQRRIIAAIARYVGNSRPTPNDRPIQALDGDDRERVPKAVMLLRLARALNQSRNGIVRGVTGTGAGRPGDPERSRPSDRVPISRSGPSKRKRRTFRASSAASSPSRAASNGA